MRTLVVALLLSVAGSALAQTVDIDINGRPYTCTPRSGGSLPGNGAGECATVAYQGPFSRDESIRLCTGARTDAPARCAIKAYQGPFSKEESLNLCTGAHSVGPADCAVKAYQGPFSKAESLSLCSSAWADVATADCAIRAYQGPYSREEALRMCRGSKSLGGEMLLSKEESDKLLIEANEKAVLEGAYKR